MASMLDEARRVCHQKHEGQTDKCGEPYYLHPFAVADMLTDETEKTVAYLHDVVEDTDTSLTELEQLGFSREVVDAVDAITRRAGEDYFDYIRRIKENKIARAVKLADLAHNTDPSRTGATPAMLERYAKAKEILS